jgi:hypothetical protein
MLKNLKKLNRLNLREIQGGGGIGKCDIGPIGCPCKIPPGDPCLGGAGGGSGSGERILSGFNLISLYRNLSKWNEPSVCSFIKIKRLS